MDAHASAAIQCLHMAMVRQPTVFKFKVHGEDMVDVLTTFCGTLMALAGNIKAAELQSSIQTQKFASELLGG